MENMPTRGEWLRNNRKPIAVFIIMFIVLPSVIILYNFRNDGNAEYEISYSVTVWILPLEEVFSLHLDFYRTPQTAEEQVNKLQGLIFEVQPSASEEHTFPLINLPEGFLGFSVRICFDSHEGEPYTILNADIGHNATTSLLGREIGILIESFQVSNN